MSAVMFLSIIFVASLIAGNHFFASFMIHSSQKYIQKGFSSKTVKIIALILTFIGSVLISYITTMLSITLLGFATVALYFVIVVLFYFHSFFRSTSFQK